MHMGTGVIPRAGLIVSRAFGEGGAIRHSIECKFRGLQASFGEVGRGMPKVLSDKLSSRESL